MGGGGHGEYSDILRPDKYKSPDEVPESMIKRYSKRDPFNRIYETRKWVDFKKKQIYYDQMDGMEVYKKNPRLRMIHTGVWVYTLCLLGTNLYFLNKYMIQGKK